AFARLARASWRLYPDVVRELQERTGIDVEYVTRGTIYPMSASQTRRDAEVWAVNKELGVEVVDGQDVQALEPALSPKISHAIFVKGDHWLNNQRLVLAYVQAAVAAGVELPGFRRAVTAEGIAGLLRAAIELAPSLRDLPIARTWCGFRPWAPDGLPILGPWPGIEGLWVSTAHFRNGILLAPITA